jgi:outer membrane protein OmpA-like peptidoglycan-associated protein
LQVVVHDAQPPRPADATDTRRADAASQALIAGGAAAGRLNTELAGARAPLVDPADARARGRNERLDVVFIASAR